MTASVEFEDRYAQLFASAERVALRILGDRAEAEDVAAETMVRVLGSWPRVRSYSTPWAARVATNLAIDVLRRRPIRSDVGAVRDEATGVDDRLLIERALRVLPARQRQAIVLRYLVGMSGPDIARVMGLSPGTVKAHVRRGLTTMRRQFDTELESQEVCHVD